MRLRPPSTKVSSNPTSRSAFYARSIYDEKILSNVVRDAEAALDIETGDEVYACGGNGCVIPIVKANSSTDVPQVLKITFSSGEARAIEEVYSAKAFQGFAQIFEPPVFLGKGKRGLQQDSYAYVREALEVPPIIELPRRAHQHVSDLLAEFSEATEDDDPEEYESVLDSLDEVVRREAPEVEGIASTIRTLFERGLMVSDLGFHNIGGRDDGTLVLFDAESYGIESETKKIAVLEAPSYQPNPLDPAQYGRFARERHTRDMTITSRKDIETRVPYTKKRRVSVQKGKGWRLDADHYLDQRGNVLAVATIIRRDRDGVEPFETNYYALPAYVST